MDPDEALKNALDAARAVTDDTTDTINSDEANTLAEAMLSLHGWLSSGGMLPAAWHLSTCMASDCRNADTDPVAQAIWQAYAVETGRSLPPGLADKLADAAYGRYDVGRSAAEHGGE